MMADRGEIHMLHRKPFFLGGIVALVILVSFIAISCGSTAKPLTTNTTGSQNIRPSNIRPAESSGEIITEVSTQGGNSEGVGSEPPGVPVTETPESTEEVSGESSDSQNPSDPVAGKSSALYQQLSRHQYKEFDLTEDMLDDLIIGFYKLPDAGFIPEKSSAYRSNKAEVIEAWFNMPEASDYQAIVDQYKSKLDANYAMQEVPTEHGTTAYFVTHDENRMWNKVISIWKYPDSQLIEIHVMFTRKFQE